MEIGQKVKVIRLRDRVPASIAERLGQIGLIEGYKMTDGSGVGIVVKFDDNFATWFFEDELRTVQ
ncbi:cytochrome B6 [Hapalosiphon sp. MRB220]|nr:cytochrome B6 [Hapalosiphon sp. MRB220]